MRIDKISGYSSSNRVKNLYLYIIFSILNSWDLLSIKTYGKCDPVIQNWAAGMIEGLVTFQKISDFYLNLLDINEYSIRVSH